MTFKQTSSAGTSPATLDELKLWIKQDGTADDALLNAINRTATKWAEDFTGRTFLRGTWEHYRDAFPGTGCIELLHGPVISVDEITYRTQGGGTGTWAGTSYQVDSQQDWARVEPVPNGSWPDSDSSYYNAVTIRYTAGYGTAGSDVPDGIKDGIKQAGAALYENRGEGEMPKFCETLLWPFRITTFR